MKSIIFTIALLAAVAIAAPSQYATPPQVQTRVEWRKLSKSAQANYISAVKCLDKLPSKLGLKTSHYNDFPYVHTKLNIQIHFVAQFLPWHRYFVHLYETSLRECGYRGSMPYWDWTLDSKDMSKSPVFLNDKTRGFGGNGLNGGFVSPARPNPLTMCVLDGAFNNFTVQYYDNALRPHCLNRGFNDGTGQAGKFQGNAYSPQAVSKIINTSMNFSTFATDLENGPHGAIHQAIGGDMIPSTSPNDPLFMVHHTQIDRLWWLWQQKNPKQRNSDFSGIRILASGETDKKKASLKDKMPMLGLGPDRLVSELMTTSSNMLSYRYE
ncbi:Tyrosinase [Fusarium circinatum]|uniref:Tyrosinase n=1 Tax=Fusarium circinatum TaxID=48490 RepID=A0A8H5XAB3_FUSCI|nr:Tyrosinase [Fusarium circinatum]